MKLFYHFLVFVFVSLLLIACASIFTTGNNVKTFNSESKSLKQSNKPDSSVKRQLKNNPYIMTAFSYKNLLKGKRWLDNQCGFKTTFYLENIQMVINQVGHHKGY